MIFAPHAFSVFFASSRTSLIFWAAAAPGIVYHVFHEELTGIIFGHSCNALQTERLLLTNSSFAYSPSTDWRFFCPNLFRVAEAAFSLRLISSTLFSIFFFTSFYLLFILLHFIFLRLDVVVVFLLLLNHSSLTLQRRSFDRFGFFSASSGIFEHVRERH